MAVPPVFFSISTPNSLPSVACCLFHVCSSKQDACKFQTQLGSKEEKIGETVNLQLGKSVNVGQRGAARGNFVCKFEHV